MDDATNPETEVDTHVEDDFAAFEQEAETDDDTDAETDDEDQPEGESEDVEDSEIVEPDTDEIEYEGQKYNIPKALKDAFLRNADYTQKTQELAEQRRQVEAAFERLQAVSQEETQALANFAIIAAQLRQYEDIDWDAWEDQDAQLGTREAQKAWRQFQALKEQQGAAVQAYNKAGEAKTSLVQQETAKRLEQADRIAAEKIPGWNGDTAKATLDFTRTNYDLSNEDLMSALSEKPGVILLLHDAMEGRKAQQQAKTKAKVEQRQIVKPAPVLKGNSGRPAFNPATTDFAAFEKHASKGQR